MNPASALVGMPGVGSLTAVLYRLPDYVPPKKPYSFLAMLDDILHFASQTLVDDGRLSFWMPTANDENQEIATPSHPCLEVVSICSQVFNKCKALIRCAPRPFFTLTFETGSRRLITYRRLRDKDVSTAALEEYVTRTAVKVTGTSADELNPFRRGYFTKFEADR